MFLRPTRPLRNVGQVLYSHSSTLPRDFYACCTGHFGVTFHEETFIGVRASQQRGLFLGSATGDHSKCSVAEANRPIATIPMSGLYTASNAGTKPNALTHVSLEEVRQAIPEAEFKVMAPQLYLGLQFSAVIHALPDITLASGPAEVARITDVLRGSANPWARLLDDEDFSEEFVFGMYGMALDTWQRTSYTDMTSKFHRTISAVYDSVKPPFKLEHMRRITRLVLARAEHTPPLDYYDGSALVRRWSRRLRQLSRTPDPTEVAMVPVLDLVNHSNRPNCGIRVGPSPVVPGGGGAITLYSLTRIHPGEELCRHYNFALSRPNALFRYGFLPFDLITIVDTDAASEHYFKNLDKMRPPSEEHLEKEKKESAELARLEALYQGARTKRR